MALKIEGGEVEKLVAELTKLTGESEEEAVRNALSERRDRLAPLSKAKRRPRTKGELLRFMEEEIWPLIPDEHLDRPPMTKAERARLLGYGPDDE